MPDQSALDPLQVQKLRSFAFDKTFGWFLLFSGLVIICVATIIAIAVFSGKSQPYKVFDAEAPSIQLPQMGSTLTVPEGVDLPPGFNINQQQASPGSVKILPDDVFNKLLNMSVFYLAMMFLASSGVKISDIGIKLIKDIKVKT